MSAAWPASNACAPAAEKDPAVARPRRHSPRAQHGVPADLHRRPSVARGSAAILVWLLLRTLGGRYAGRRNDWSARWLVGRFLRKPLDRSSANDGAVPSPDLRHSRNSSDHRRSEGVHEALDSQRQSTHRPGYGPAGIRLPRKREGRSTPGGQMILENRILEPELMDDERQSIAYAKADFSASNQLFVDGFVRDFPGHLRHAVDIGCGPGDVVIRLARAASDIHITAIDGSKPMLSLARAAVRANGLESRVRLVEGYVPGVALQDRSYDA